VKTDRIYVRSVTSNALKVWQEDRSRRFDRLVSAHHRMLETEALGQWEADELAHVVLLRLAAEFQGFCRDLHNDCIEAFIATLGLSDQRLELIISTQNMESGRRLDSGNANRDAIAQDFSRFGLEIWLELERGFPTSAREWVSAVRLLNTARNGIAHDFDAKLDQLRRDGHELSLSTALDWRSAVDTCGRCCRGRSHGEGNRRD
jgi:hypothetical protein